MHSIKVLASICLERAGLPLEWRLACSVRVCLLLLTSVSFYARALLWTSLPCSAGLWSSSIACWQSRDGLESDLNAACFLASAGLLGAKGPSAEPTQQMHPDRNEQVRCPMREREMRLLKIQIRALPWLSITLYAWTELWSGRADATGSDSSCRGGE